MGGRALDPDLCTWRIDKKGGLHHHPNSEGSHLKGKTRYPAGFVYKLGQSEAMEVKSLSIIGTYNA